MSSTCLQVLRSLGLMADLDIDELESLAQRVEMAKHQVYSVTQLLASLHSLFVIYPYIHSMIYTVSEGYRPFCTICLPSILTLIC